MRPTYYLDLESIGSIDLPKLGVKAYAAHPETFITMISFNKKNDTSYHCAVRPDYDFIDRTKDVKKYLEEMLSHKAIKLVAHNYMFEKLMLEHCGDEFLQTFGITKSFKDLDIEYIDTKELSLALTGPAGLEQACTYFNIESKDNLGNRVMKATCRLADISGKSTTKKVEHTQLDAQRCYITRRGKEYSYWGGPDIVDILVTYCKQDVRATKKLHTKLARIYKEETPEFKAFFTYGSQVTRQANEGGIKVDKERLERLAKLAEDFFLIGGRLAQKYMGIERFSLARTRWLPGIQAQGIHLPNMRAETLEKFVSQDKDNPEVVEALKYYLLFNKTSLNRLINYRDRLAYTDYKFYDFLRFEGALTGRWTSPSASVQNLPRPHKELETLEDVDKFLDLIGDDADKLLEGNNIDKFLGCMRTILVPKEKDKRFFVADLSQIEYRVACYLGGYIDNINRLDKGFDVYKELTAKLFKVPEEDVDSTMRQCGKEGALSLQFGVGWDAYQQACADTYGVSLSDKEAQEIVERYKREHNSIIKKHISYGRRVSQCVKHRKPLQTKLSTNRYLRYNVPKTKTVTKVMSPKEIRRKKNGTLPEWITPTKQKGNWVYSKNVMTYTTGVDIGKIIHGPKLFQNQVQAEARDILLIKMADMYKKGYKLSLMVHDEVIYECDKGDEQIAKDWEEAGKETIEKFFPGLAVSSDCGFLERYYKI